MKAVIFDLGGVVLESPLHFIADYEREQGLPENFVARVVGGYAARPEGPWQRLERGELSFDEFCEAFDREIEAMGQQMSTAHMMQEMAKKTVVRMDMVGAIRRLREGGFQVAALTNNWKTNDEQYARMDELRDEFHVFVESCRVGMRKPDPRIYEHTLSELDVDPTKATFLDDIGKNLKAARQLGMTTIKVIEPKQALEDLEKVVGMSLLG